MPRINHQNNFATNLTSDQIAGVTTTPLNSIPTADAPYYIALDATNVNSHYDVVYVTSDSATNINHAATTYAHTTTEEVRMVVPAAELDILSTPATGAQITTGTDEDNYITSKTLADATVGKLGAAWATWTPSLTNITQGSGTVVAKYIQIGKVVDFYFRFILAADSAVGTTPTFSLPVTTKAGLSGNIGRCKLDDATGSVFAGFVTVVSTTTAKVEVLTHGASYITLSGCTATIPFTWTTSDEIVCHGTYEVA